jgi:hypothetical protein
MTPSYSLLAGPFTGFDFEFSHTAGIPKVELQLFTPRHLNGRHVCRVPCAVVCKSVPPMPTVKSFIISINYR